MGSPSITSSLAFVFAFSVMLLPSRAKTVAWLSGGTIPFLVLGGIIWWWFTREM